jgi:hypothetical protein
MCLAKKRALTIVVKDPTRNAMIYTIIPSICKKENMNTLRSDVSDPVTREYVARSYRRFF